MGSFYGDPVLTTSNRTSSYERTRERIIFFFFFVTFQSSVFFLSLFFFSSPKNGESNDRTLLIKIFFFFNSCAEMSSPRAQSLIKHVLNTTRWKQPCSRISDRRIDELRKSVWCGNTTTGDDNCKLLSLLMSYLKRKRKKRWRLFCWK